MKSIPGTFILDLALVVVFGVELITHTMGNETALLGLGALPTDGHLNGEYWRVITFSFLHLDWLHLFLNLAMLYWIGRIIEQRVSFARFAFIFEVSSIASAAAILTLHSFYPTPGSAGGASGGIFGFLGAALVLAYRRDAAVFGQDRRIRMGLWLFLIFGLGISFIPGVSHVGHLSGLIIGALLGAIVNVKPNAT